MTSVDEHAAHIEQLLAPLFEIADADSVPLSDALGRVTADVVRSPVDLPLFRNSQMDGFAVLASDLLTVPVTLPVVGDQPAGAGTPPPLRPGTAVRIMTGAMVPDGADCIVPVENTRFVAGSRVSSASDNNNVAGGRVTMESARDTESVVGGRVTIETARVSGEYVRERGSDLRAGGQLLPAGLRLAPRHLAALAAAGIDEVRVRRRARVAVVTTGAELVRERIESATPGHGQIFDANLIALITAVRESGADIVLADATDDIPHNLVALLDRAVLAGADLILTSGGVSQGAFEVVREVLEPLGGRVGTIAMQPGGPQATAIYAGIPLIGFPGNPVSTQVSFVVLVRALLRRAAGLPPAHTGIYPLASAVSSITGKRQFLRGRYIDDESANLRKRRVEIVSGPSSHLVAGMARADVLVDIPADVTELAEGADVRVWEL